MFQVNLRVPLNLSKNIDEVKRSCQLSAKIESIRGSVSLRIPNKSLASVSQIQRKLSTPTKILDIQNPKKKKLGTVKSLEFREKARKLARRLVGKEENKRNKKSRDANC